MLQQHGILNEGTLANSNETVARNEMEADIRKGPPISKPALPNRKEN